MTDVQVGAVAPVVPVTPAVDAAPAPEPTVSPDAETPKPEQPPERTFTQKELDEIVQKRAAQAERKALRIAREEREYLQRQIAQQTPQQSQPTTPGKPDPKDFKDFESWVDAVADWKLDQKLTSRDKQAQEQSYRAQQNQSVQQQFSAVQENLLGPGAEKYGDDFEGQLKSIPLSPAMLTALVESDVGPDVAQRLYTNPAEAKRIFSLPASRQVIELGKLEDQVKAPPKPTQTPPPIVPNAAKSSVDKDPEKMSNKEFREWRLRQIAQRR